MTRQSTYGVSTRAAGHWSDRARCTQLVEAGLEDPDLWFPIGNPPQDSPQVKAARLECARCPVWAECREDALERGEDFGVWGGLSERQRRAITKQRAA